VRALAHWCFGLPEISGSERSSTRRVSLILWVPRGNITSYG
jgi:hypothetical protein